MLDAEEHKVLLARLGQTCVGAGLSWDYSDSDGVGGRDDRSR